MDYMDLFDDHPIGIIRLDKKDLPQKSNRTALDFLGYSEDELYNSEFRSRINPEDAETDRTLFYEILSGDREFYDLPCRYIRKDGTNVWGYSRVFIDRSYYDGSISHLTRLILDLNKTIEASYMIKTDIQSDNHVSEMNNMQNMLQRAMQLEYRGLVAIGTLHDINCVISTTHGYLELIKHETHVESPMLERINALLKINTVGRKSIDEVFNNYYRPTKPINRLIDVNKFITEMRLNAYFYSAKNVKVDLKFKGKNLSVRISNNLMLNIIGILVRNASEAIQGDDGIIQVSTGTTECSNNSLANFHGGDAMTPGKYIFIKVIDNGCGLDKDKQKNVFKPYFTTKPGHKGLGLTEVKRNIRFHKGAVAFYSKPGKGSSVIILLPEAKNIS